LRRGHTTDSIRSEFPLHRIFVDADACPVKPEIYKVARRYGWSVTLVANTVMAASPAPWLTVAVVEGHANAADDWIAEHTQMGDIVVTADVPLAARCLENGAAVLDSRGRAFTEDSIGNALASRDLMDQLRAQGATIGGPAPFQPKHRSQFLQKLDQSIQSIRRRYDS
jgi:uncharacterized protein YaiI (UPF0178 family)